jgi:hypothetical protein
VLAEVPRRSPREVSFPLDSALASSANAASSHLSIFASCLHRPVRKSRSKNMLDAALVLDFDSDASANVASLATFWVLPYVIEFGVRASSRSANAFMHAALIQTHSAADRAARLRPP